MLISDLVFVERLTVLFLASVALSGSSESVVSVCYLVGASWILIGRTTRGSRCNEYVGCDLTCRNGNELRGDY